MKALLPSLFLLFLGIAVLSSCQSSSSSSDTDAPLMDTVITEIRDTVITFYPETYEETVQVVVSYDTVITPRVKEAE